MTTSGTVVVPVAQIGVGGGTLTARGGMASIRQPGTCPAPSDAVALRVRGSGAGAEKREPARLDGRCLSPGTLASFSAFRYDGVES